MEIKNILSGTSFYAHKTLGAHPENNGVRFGVFAPEALNVTLIGEFSSWAEIPMSRDENGVWHCFVDNAVIGQMYKFKISEKSGAVRDRIDPFAFFSERRPGNASVIYDISKFSWNDGEWLRKREKNFNSPLNIYEVHPGSWQKDEDGEFLSYDELSKRLIPYVKSIGATHIELMPFTEHPLDASWGYQTTGYFSATSRFGEPCGLMKLIDECHKENIGVIMDFVPLHFASDNFALYEYDGGHIFESNDEQQRYSRWGTILFDFTKPFVMSFLHSALIFWIENYHIDGIRFDAVSDMLYHHGSGDEGLNEAGIWFMKTANYFIDKHYKGVMLIAEDSSIFTKVTAPVEYGGIGFDYKWDLGWMNNTLYYMSLPFDKRERKSDCIRHSMDYFYNEEYILPLSHDEVSHGKKSLMQKMFGDFEQRYLQLKLLLLYTFTHPGKKLLFMGTEIPTENEWNEDKQLEWNTYRTEEMTAFIKELVTLYSSCRPLFENDFDSRYFAWREVSDEDCFFMFERSSKDGEKVTVALNFSDEKVSRKIMKTDGDIIFSSGSADITTTKNTKTLKLGALSGVIIGKKSQ